MEPIKKKELEAKYDILIRDLLGRTPEWYVLNLDYKKIQVYISKARMVSDQLCDIVPEDGIIAEKIGTLERIISYLETALKLRSSNELNTKLTTYA